MESSVYHHAVDPVGARTGNANAAVRKSGMTKPHLPLTEAMHLGLFRRLVKDPQLIDKVTRFSVRVVSQNGPRREY